MKKHIVGILILLFVIILLVFPIVKAITFRQSCNKYDIVFSEGHTFKLNKQTGEVSVLVFYDIFPGFVRLGDINLTNVTDEDKAKFYKDLSESLKAQKALEIYKAVK